MFNSWKESVEEFTDMEILFEKLASSLSACVGRKTFGDYKSSYVFGRKLMMLIESQDPEGRV